MLQKWVQSGENLQAVECELQIQRKQQGELEHGRELLTVAEMQSKGFSQIFDGNYAIFEIFKESNLLISRRVFLFVYISGCFSHVPLIFHISNLMFAICRLRSEGEN